MNGHDDDGNETNGNSAAAGAQGIFSTPELTVDTEKIAQNQKSDRSRMASVFANTEAGQRSQKLNDAMGISTQPLTQSEMQPATEDVVTNKVPRKRSKTLLVVVLVVLILVIGGVMLGSGIVANMKDKRSYNQAKTAFLEYANLIVYGETSDDKLNNNCLEDSSCYLFQAMQTKDSWDVFSARTTTAKEKLTKALNVWVENLKTVGHDDQKSSELVREMQNLIDMQDFINIYFSRNILKKSDIVNYYFQNGEDGIQDYIANYYGQNNGDNIYLNSLRDDVLSMGSAVLENIGIYAKYGCMTEIMSEACFISSAATEDERATVANNNEVVADYGIEVRAYANAPYNFASDVLDTINLFNTYEQMEQE